MAMAAVCTAGPVLVEAYAIGAAVLQGETDEETAEKTSCRSTAGMAADDGKKIPGECFFWVSKKNDSAKVSSVTEPDCDRIRRKS
ncbi:hypothetical protein OWV82_024541 [Melia azedarach]|uniref:Uncharacterized protein n=1 Tax=Melia azedarach TaxID=155640 RepID=A0ACC1WQ10_MELAZ|nr:hypothetical protein OWV82_024541 [Melia azedarach]